MAPITEKPEKNILCHQIKGYYNHCMLPAPANQVGGLCKGNGGRSAGRTDIKSGPVKSQVPGKACRQVRDRQARVCTAPEIRGGGAGL